jgi:hypothetical protein
MLYIGGGREGPRGGWVSEMRGLGGGALPYISVIFSFYSVLGIGIRFFLL